MRFITLLRYSVPCPSRRRLGGGEQTSTEGYVPPRWREDADSGRRHRPKLDSPISGGDRSICRSSRSLTRQSAAAGPVGLLKAKNHPEKACPNEAQRPPCTQCPENKISTTTSSRPRNRMKHLRFFRRRKDQPSTFRAKRRLGFVHRPIHDPNSPAYSKKHPRFRPESPRRSLL